MGVFGYFRKSSDTFIESHCFARVCNFNSCFPWSNQSICQSIKENELLEDVASSSLMLCRSKNAEKKIRSLLQSAISVHVLTSITTMKIKVKCKLTNHIYWRNIDSFLSPLCHEVSIPASTQRRAINGPPAIGHWDGISLADRW